MPNLTSQPVRAAAAAVVDVAVLVVYLVLLSSSAASPDGGRAAVVVGYLVLLCVLSLSGAVLSARTGPVAGDVLRAAAVGNIAMGVVALASFGIPLVLTGAVLPAPGAGRTSTSRTRAIVLPVVMVLVLVVGIALTGGR